MSIARGTALCTLLVLLGATLAWSQPVPEQDRLARTLAIGSHDERAEAMAAIQRISVRGRGEVVLQALIREAHRLSAERDERMRILAAGGTVGSLLPYPGYRRDALRPLTAFDDPRVIPALMPFITSGGMVTRALASFGEPALPHVAQAALGATSAEGAPVIGAALHTMQTMLTTPVRQSLSAASRRTILDIARLRLTGDQAVLVVDRAVRLAVATRDPGLTQRVRVIAEDGAEVRAFGITDPVEIARVQRAAAEAIERLER